MPLSSGLRRSRTGRGIRRRLGLPAFSRRTWLWVILVILGLSYLGATVVADFVTKAGRYAPQYYEPKDFRREPPPQKNP